VGKERIPNVHVLIYKLEQFVKNPEGDVDQDTAMKCLRVLNCMFKERPCDPQCDPPEVYPEIPEG